VKRNLAPSLYPWEGLVSDGVLYKHALLVVVYHSVAIQGRSMAVTIAPRHRVALDCDTLLLILYKCCEATGVSAHHDSNHCQPAVVELHIELACADALVAVTLPVAPCCYKEQQAQAQHVPHFSDQLL
jgi:hypothetical protein